MAEKNIFADKIAESIAKLGSNYGIAEDEIMIIHTDNSGDVRKSDLESLRDEARDVDNPKNKIKVIVSVLMLREGWDVQNITIVLGLRAFDSAILPEQAIGRGLRLMRDISPDRTQTLEVIGNENFEKIVKQLELEGVGINTTATPPPLPVTIAPEKKRLQYDIEIPSTDFSYTRAYKNLRGIDEKNFPSLFTTDKLNEERKTLLKMEVMNLGIEVHQAEIKSEFLELGRDMAAYIVTQVMKKAGLTDCFQFVYPICEDYILNKCFEVKIDDIDAFSALADIFRIDYLSNSGAIRYYFPDFIAVQSVEKKKVCWILETKGREYPDLENKNKAIERWCSAVTKQTGNEWGYLLIKQAFFNVHKKTVTTLKQLEGKINGQVSNL